jgi:acetylornithine deacetylase/succinyl-diaminopimelate desuccinylase-like protein
MLRTEKLLRELIALPSVNPAFVPAGESRSGEQQVAEFLAATGAQAGLDVSFQPVSEGRSNLLLRLTPRGKTRQRVLLAPHLDTVNGTRAQFAPRRKGGRLFGRGAADAKGSVAAMFGAVCAVAQLSRRPAETEIIFAGLVDEENAQAGSRALVKQGFRADFAIVGEPTRLRVVTAHKGSLWLQLETHGRCAHGARPELGQNAIHTMAGVVNLLETRYAAALSRRRHPLLGPPTVSVGTIRGGAQPNIVPDHCAIVVDRRTLPGETEAGVRCEILEFLRRAGLPATLGNGKEAPCLPLETNPQLPLVARFLRATRQRQPAGVHYFCDAAILSEAGIPSVVFGPGDIAQAHTSDEWISLASLERAQALLERFLGSLP